MESVSTCENKVEQHFTLLKWVGKKYKTLINNMVVNNKFVEATKANLVNLYDVGIIFSLPCVFLMLESINGLMKFV
jgi:hypothetical protein